MLEAGGWNAVISGERVVNKYSVRPTEDVGQGEGSLQLAGDLLSAGLGNRLKH